MDKVHRSLACAGKVRGQTPKVAKQDKKKKLRVRAHKRMQYNRHFVTAVVGFGKKRGPNSSEKYATCCMRSLVMEAMLDHEAPVSHSYILFVAKLHFSLLVYTENLTLFCSRLLLRFKT
ncbi:40S ribosomal protein S30-like [Juglans microcarpa x Juglans regia]|uniref:40S ribosomal protein S30-like n=1 Tax=Juglans microcarpa x Juglans regia TaxID=2249226 RepID=UPI001B7E6F0A|nr:40S ribosomal protein S30-like [Juglans microcarpa x Juglans regia]